MNSRFASELQLEEWFERVVQPQTRLRILRCHRHRAGRSWRIRPRVIQEHIFYYILRGQVDVLIGERSTSWSAGQAAWVGPGIPQQANWNPEEPLEFFVLKFRLEDAQGRVLSAPLPPGVVDAPGTLLHALDELSDLLTLEGPLQQLRLRAQMLNLLAMFAECDSGITQVDGLNATQRKQLQRTLQNQIQSPFNSEELARVCKLAPATFRRKFKATYGCSARQWIAQERMRQIADALLENDRTLEDLISEYGLESVPSFTRQFSKQFGCSPREWRQQGERPQKLRSNIQSPSS